MKFARRRFLQRVAAGASFAALSRIAQAQSYPTRLVRVIVPYAPGGPNDVLARLMSQWLSDRLGQPFVIDNRPGAGGNIGTEAVVKASPDGYMLLMVSTSNTINATLYEKLSFNFGRDIAPIATIIRQPQVMLVNPLLPVKTVREFIAYAKANPGRISMASAGTGTPPHVAGELFKMMAGVDMIHVPYRGGGPALMDLLGGQVQVAFIGSVASIEYIRTGKLRALAVTTETRSEALPEFPTVGDFVPGYEASSWFGIGAPRATPAEIVAKLNQEVNAALVDPRMKARLAELGGMVLAGSPDDFAKLIAADTAKWAKVVQFAGAKAD